MVTELDLLWLLHNTHKYYVVHLKLLYQLYPNLKAEILRIKTLIDITNEQVIRQ